MKPDRLYQSILIVALLVVSWLGAMGVHELGHVIAAKATGGEVQRVVWHPLALSRTDVMPNPRPGVVVWGGPIVGVVLPLVAGVIAWALRVRWGYLVWFFVGACWIVNGAYIGVGSFDPVGDAQVMLRTGSPRWVLAVFGLIVGPAGLWIWHRVSGRLGFGRVRMEIEPRHAWLTVGIAGTLVAGLLVFGDPG